MEKILESLPMIPLRGMTILPEMVVHFDISRKKSIEAVQEAMVGDQRIFLVTQREVETEEPQQKELFEIGTIGTIKQVIKLPKKILRILVVGEERAMLRNIECGEPYMRALVEVEREEKKELPEEEGIQEQDPQAEALVRNLKEMFAELGVKSPKVSKETVAQILDIDDPKKLVRQICANIPLPYRELQELLNEGDPWKLYELLSFKLVNELQIMNIKEELQVKVKERVDKHQREYILREQLKLIREELGDDTTMSDAEEFEAATKKMAASKEVKEKLMKEIKRFKNSMGSAAETSVIRTYIETMLEMPWDKKKEESYDLSYAKEVLEKEHYGLEEVKERVLEYLAVRTLTQKGNTPILCLVGPPGTGKTSIARSLAKALHKPYVRISLGGVKDEAEIRGHRKTYVGAMPGRIANGLKTAGVKNPLMLLDEIDKASSDYKGDTFSALLEVLDSEQNYKFRDHYLEVPVDLSEVLFVTTANSLQTIPRPLLDRMEIIEISSYTENEKEHIADRHLIPKQLERHGLSEEQLQISKNAVGKMIRSYTKEAGVRQLERKIGAICRKSAKGIVRGLAWTSVGGDTLQIEVNLMPGKGELLLTGQLGDVMKESAMAGISYIRSISEKYGIEADYFEKHDFHVHIPEGAVPKDGPSAGITMATAIFSAILNRKVRADVAMTGEITLRGRVLPIGGLKEKLLAAKNAGIKKVLIPARNKRDVEELSAEITKGLEIIPVEQMEEVLEHAFVPE